MSYCLKGATAQELFLQAQAAYQEKKFEEALKLYNEIEPKSESVWFCIGNCNLELDQPIQALIAWKKAATRCFVPARMKMIQTNIQKIKNKLSLPESSVITSIIDSIENYVRVIPLFWWQIIFLITWFVLISSGIWLIQKKYYFRLISLVAIGIICAIVIAIRYSVITRVTGIVTKPSPICLSCDLRLASERSLVPGQELKVLKKNDKWCKVMSDNHNGWVPSEVITIL